MKFFLAFVILVILLLIGAFIWERLKSRGKDESPGRPYQIQAVATDHEECSKIGNDTLNSNGSAVDAAIASVLSGSYKHAIFWSWWRWSDVGL